MRTSSARAVLTALCVAVLGTSGCLTGRPERGAGEFGPSPHLQRAERLYELGRYEEALVEVVEIAHRHPHAAGLDDLRHRVLSALTEQQELSLDRDARLANRRMALEVERNKSIPTTHGLRRFYPGDTTPLRTAGVAAQAMLAQPVTLHLEGVNLDDFILAIGASEGINIVADNLDTDRRMTIHADQVPFREILDYAARNLGVAFYAGENLIWATARPPEEPDTPMETRLYRLRKGLSGDELTTGDVNLILAIERFVPAPEGSDLLFDRKAHALIVRNTRENLARVEDLIEHLDVCPPQILIEARFISASVSDLQELGIDWLLKSPIVTSRKAVTEDGLGIRAPRTQIDAGGSVAFMAAADQAHGLNMTYQGLLTEPMFQAVLHALHLSGKARTLSAPKVTTVNNREARIRVGEDFRYFDTYNIVSVSREVGLGTTVQDSYLVPEGTPQLEELGIELVVTPSVGADLESITLKLAPEISEFIRFEYFETSRQGSAGVVNGVTNGSIGVLKLPIFRRNMIETEVIARSGETVVMGGLITQSDQAQEQKVPLLSSIPFIGRLFRSDGVRENKQNLLIFVTAKLLTQRGEDLLPLRDPTLSPDASIRSEFFPVRTGIDAAAPPPPPPPRRAAPGLAEPLPQFHRPPQEVDFE